MATLIPIISAFLAAVAGVLARVLLKNIPTQKILAVNFFIMALTLLIISPFFYKFVVSGQSIALIVLIGIIDAFANYFYFKTFEKTEASVAVPILSLAPVVTFLSSALFLREYPSVLSVIGAMMIIGLIILISTDWKQLPKFKSATLYPALASAFLFGISSIPSKYILSTLEATNAPTLYMFRAIIICLFALIVFKNTFTNLSFKTYWFIFIRGIFVIGQWILLYYALTLGSTGVAVTLGNITPVFVLFLSILFLREHFSWKKVVAAITILVISFII